jgi:CRP-like cAMP-binding protein
MTSPTIAHILDRMVRKFETRASLDENDRAALYRLPFDIREVAANRYIAREGDRPPGATLIVAGLAYRHKVTIDGSRQILSVHIPGDFIDLEASLLRVADHNVQALTPCEIAIVPRAALLAVIEQYPRLARAMWVDTLIDASIYREWIVNVGRRDARSGMCHLLCEFARRLEGAGMAEPGGGYELPMTQEQLADALGITPVHVNRVLRDLDRDGLIVRDKRFVRLPNWEALRRVGGFSELYLHLDQVAPPIQAGQSDHLAMPPIGQQYGGSAGQYSA